MSIDRDTLLEMLGEDEFGLLKTPSKRRTVTADDRLLAAFQEITDFIRAHGREPERTLADMTEARLAMRLQAIRGNEAQASALRCADQFGLLGEAPPESKPVVLPEEPPESIEDAMTSDPFGLLGGADIFELKHVPAAPTMPEQIATRKPAANFELYEPLFKSCHADLRIGRRKLLPFKNPSEIERGKFFVLNGVLLYVADIGEAEFAKSNKGRNARTRCIFENGTESDLLALSLGRNLYKDGRRVTEPNDVTLERMGLEADTKMGYIYVLRSLSDDPQLARFDSPHKIGLTTQTVDKRIAGADAETTYLVAPVEEVARYALPAVAVQQVESLLHSFFAAVRLDVWFEREGKVAAEAKEWFDVPLSAIDEAIDLINAETIGNYSYDVDHRRITLASG